MDVAVEHESDEPPLGVDQRAARVAAHDVVAGREIEGRLRIELRPQREPAVGNAEGLLAGGALEQARESGEGLDLAAVLLPALHGGEVETQREGDRKSTRLNSSHVAISYAVFCLKKKKNNSRRAISISAQQHAD